MTTYYAVLEVSPQASPEEIRRAYRRLVLLTHPDRTADPAAHRRYLAVNEAYEVLGNVGRRQQYDYRLQQLAAPPSPLPRPASQRRPAPVLVVRKTRAAPTYNLRPYVQPVRYVGQALGGLVVLLLLDYVLLRHNVRAAFTSIEGPSYPDMQYLITTSHGYFSTPFEVPLTTPYLQVRTSWLLPFVYAAWLPGGTAIPVAPPAVGSLHCFAGLLLLLSLLTQWTALSLPARINLLLAAILVAIILGLMLVI